MEPPRDRGIRLVEPDGHHFAVVARGDGFDVFHGRDRIATFGVSAEAMVQVAWWVVWRWWVLGTWCGFKIWWADRARRRRLRRDHASSQT